MPFMNYIAQWKSVAKEALDRSAIIAKFLCYLHFTGNYLCSPTHAYGPSMLPTLNIAGDVVLVEHVSPRIGKVGHGDLVLVKSPLNPNRNLTKRVVAMEGDTVTYFDPLNSEDSRIAVVPKGHVWIQGDNVYASRDSRHFGPVPYGLIRGKVFFRVWPPSSFGRLDN
ncbi:putative signal peptidase I [Medicago truncatula]|uniref:Inner membrane protease subunit 1 n=1 Tax=Medicago truncatula TaxID=3880 RepID=I3T5V1_MEDTR|nr:mitochondrial inner membrane protease subunit 1 [Medicago truncatula]AFK47893.1 unknown [Medicago truncatula]KEH38481.1 inner membrane protease subunit 1 [Medicago truncatula]RHN74763.1 putative signal peptidase I [Medicago truncatula]